MHVVITRQRYLEIPPSLGRTVPFKGIGQTVILSSLVSRVQIEEFATKLSELLFARGYSEALQKWPMYLLRALALLFLAHAVLAEQPTPILPDSKLTPGDTFDVTAQDVCVRGYAKKVRAVPAWLKRERVWNYGVQTWRLRS
jgi:hypothetical protein